MKLREYLSVVDPGMCGRHRFFYDTGNPCCPLATAVKLREAKAKPELYQQFVDACMEPGLGSRTHLLYELTGIDTHVLGKFWQSYDAFCNTSTKHAAFEQALKLAEEYE